MIGPWKWNLCLCSRVPLRDLTHSKVWCPRMKIKTSHFGIEKFKTNKIQTFHVPHLRSSYTRWLTNSDFLLEFLSFFLNSENLLKSFWLWKNLFPPQRFINMNENWMKSRKIGFRSGTFFIFAENLSCLVQTPILKDRL